jgi:hypothetical protein
MKPKLTREQSERVEALALRLYDQYNPQSDKVINVSKAKCLAEAREKLFPKSKQ